MYSVFQNTCNTTAFLLQLLYCNNIGLHGNLYIRQISPASGKNISSLISACLILINTPPACDARLRLIPVFFKTNPRPTTPDPNPDPSHPTQHPPPRPQHPHHPGLPTDLTPSLLIAILDLYLGEGYPSSIGLARTTTTPTPTITLITTTATTMVRETESAPAKTTPKQPKCKT
ncbi:hypothetical protein CPB84DRAFT_1523123 [Gymnopilus junonius]|uniref:Uncharacterized protein n=1 Tax=Gymnopilus junonius TaxID=109634 RepID=A0A9P5NIH2_GYMJU|nr:hypothetical protein CPB84DRAFT_1523123 [Gymnopilus junonius]